MIGQGVGNSLALCLSGTCLTLNLSGLFPPVLNTGMNLGPRTHMPESYFKCVNQLYNRENVREAKQMTLKGKSLYGQRLDTKRKKGYIILDAIILEYTLI